MKVRVSPSALNEALQIATGVAPSRATIPALGCVRLEARKGADGPELTVSATDLDLGIRLSVPLVSLDREGVLVLPAPKISGLVREVQDADIEIASDQALGLVKTSDGQFKIVGMDAAEFPALQEFAEAKAVAIPAKDLIDMVGRTAFAVSNEAVRYALTGQLVAILDGELRIVASDGRRLSYTRKPSKGKKGPHAIVPAKTLALLTKALTPEDEEVRAEANENSIRFATKRALVFSRLIEGSFPDYEAVIPKGNDRKATMECEALRSALRRTSLLTQDRARSVKMTLGNGKAKLFARAQDVGEATVEIPAEFEGDPLEIVFNPDYILDYLRTVSEEKVVLSLKDKQSAGLFQASEDHLYVLMPLALDSL
jgi:DNA polymerase-3 subunit beta